MKVACRTNGFPSLKSPCLLLLLDAGEGGMLHPDRALADVSFPHRTTSIPSLRDRPELSGRGECDQASPTPAWSHVTEERLAWA